MEHLLCWTVRFSDEHTGLLTARDSICWEGWIQCQKCVQGVKEAPRRKPTQPGEAGMLMEGGRLSRGGCDV